MYGKYHCRARRIVENSFGLLAHRFRCLLSRMHVQPKFAAKITMACAILHNFLIKKTASYASSPGLLDVEDSEGNVRPGSWRTLMTEEMRLRGGRGQNHSSKEATFVRDQFAEYFMATGALPFQHRMIKAGYK